MSDQSTALFHGVARAQRLLESTDQALPSLSMILLLLDDPDQAETVGATMVLLAELRREAQAELS
jgi:hypothetical protein